MERALRLFTLALLASLGFLAASCASEEPRPKGPEDDVSGLPWNRPMPGEKGGAMGGMPFQSH